MKTVVALYDEIEDARDAVEDLVDAGVTRGDVSLIARDVDNQYSRYVDGDEAAEQVGEAAAVGATGGAVIGGLAGVLVGMGALAIPGIGPVVAAGPIAAGLTGAGMGALAGGLLGALAGWGIPEGEAEYYAEGVRRGGTLVAVKVSDERAEDVVDILEDHNPVDVERRAEYWRSEYDWTGYDAEAEPYDADQLSRYREQRKTWESNYTDYDYDDDLDTGAADMRSRAIRSYAGSTGAGSTMATGTRNTASNFADYDQEFRRHYNTRYATTGYDYNQYQPAYQYGYTLGTDPRYQNADWMAVERSARRGWEDDHDSAWEDFKDAVRHGWERATRAVS